MLCKVQPYTDVSNAVSPSRQGCLRQRYPGINLRVKPHSPIEDLWQAAATASESRKMGQSQASPSAKHRAKHQFQTAFLRNEPSRSPPPERLPRVAGTRQRGWRRRSLPTRTVPVGGSSPAAPKALPSGSSGQRARRPGPAERRRGTGRAGRAASCALQPRSPRRAPAPVTCYSRCRRAAPRRRRRG